MRSSVSLEKYREDFPERHSLIVAIHVRELHECLRNVEKAREGGANGAFLVNHGDMSPGFSGKGEGFMDVLQKVKSENPDFRIGINELHRSPVKVFSKIEELPVDGVRVDNPMIKEVTGVDKAEEIKSLQNEINWSGLYFGGFAFKHQPQPEYLHSAASAASSYIDVFTTSGPGTGKSIDIGKLKAVREAIGDAPLALASGVDKHNISECLDLADSFIVATGVSDDFYTLNKDKCSELSELLDN